MIIQRETSLDQIQYIQRFIHSSNMGSDECQMARSNQQTQSNPKISIFNCANNNSNNIFNRNRDKIYVCIYIKLDDDDES